jgi:hypothetical protein
MWKVAVSVLGLAVCGCSGGVNGGGGSGNSSLAGISPPGISLPGLWAGYIEAYSFPSGSDELEITIASVNRATGAATGSVRFGEGPPPAPPTDGDVGYPAGFNFNQESWLLHEGFAYTLVDATLTDARFTATFSINELWSEWCPLQTSYPNGNSPEYGYSCVPNWGTMGSNGGCAQVDPMTGQPVPVDCGKLFLCDQKRVCSCDANQCVVAVQESVTLDVAIDGAIADGTIEAYGKRMNIRLENP